MPIMPIMGKELTVAVSKEQLKGLFREYDRNRDGQLDKNELKDAFKRLGATLPGWRAGRGLRKADANGDGFVSEEELTELVKYAIQFGRNVSVDGKIQMRPDEFKKWLKQFDTDKDGRISQYELREAIRATGGWFTTRKCKDGLRFADQDGDGYIEDEEIKNLKDFALKNLGVRIITY